MVFTRQVSALEALDNEVQVVDEDGGRETSLAVALADVKTELSKPTTGALATIWARQARRAQARRYDAFGVFRHYSTGKDCFFVIS